MSFDSFFTNFGGLLLIFIGAAAGHVHDFVVAILDRHHPDDPKRTAIPRICVLLATFSAACVIGWYGWQREQIDAVERQRAQRERDRAQAELQWAAEEHVKALDKSREDANKNLADTKAALIADATRRENDAVERGKRQLETAAAHAETQFAEQNRKLDAIQKENADLKSTIANYHKMIVDNQIFNEIGEAMVLYTFDPGTIVVPTENPQLVHITFPSGRQVQLNAGQQVEFKPPNVVLQGKPRVRLLLKAGESPTAFKPQGVGASINQQPTVVSYSGLRNTYHILQRVPDSMLVVPVSE